MGTQTYSTAGDLIWTALATSVTAQIWGNGGAGEDGSGTTDSGGGGGGGAYVTKVISGLTIGNGYTVHIEAAETHKANGSQPTFPTAFNYFQSLGVCKAQNGQGGGAASSGLGGAYLSSIGDSGYSGGIGGDAFQGNGTDGGGGGGSAGTASNGTRTLSGTGAAAVTGGGKGGDGGSDDPIHIAPTAPGLGGGAGGGAATGVSSSVAGDGGLGQIILTWSQAFSPTLASSAVATATCSLSLDTSGRPAVPAGFRTKLALALKV